MFVLSSMRSDCYDDSCPQSRLFLGHVVLKRGAKLSRVPRDEIGIHTFARAAMAVCVGG